MTDVFGTGMAWCVWFMTKLSLPEGPNNCMLSLRRLSNTRSIKWVQSSWGQWVNSSYLLKSPWVRHSLTVIFCEKMMGHTSMPARWLLPLSCSCGLVPFHLSHCKNWPALQVRIKECKESSYNCLKLVISHLLSDLQKMQGAFHVPCVSHNPLKAQITRYSLWTLT